MDNNSLLQVTTTFADKQVCIDYLAKMRWPDNKICCPHCKYPKVYILRGKTKGYKCAECRKPFSALKGTIFENSPITLQKWFVAIYLHTSHKKGISSCQLAKDIEVTQKTAWFMLSRIRYMLESGKFEHSEDAIIEIDETFVGGESNNKHENKKTRNERGGTVSIKTPVIGIIERGGNVTAKAIKDTHKDTILPEIYKNVTEGAKIMTDDYKGYKDLAKKYEHQTVCHSDKEYVRGEVHTNGIENFWSHFQRGITGIYHHVSDKHLDKYVDEFEFRFNTRKLSEGERFEKTLSLSNRRLTYAALIANNGKDANPIFQFRPEL